MSNCLRIALPSSSFLPFLGGVEVGLHNLATQVIARGHMPVVMVPYLNYRRLQEEGWKLPYDIERFPSKFFTVLRLCPWLAIF